MKHKRLLATSIFSTLSCISDGMQYGWTAPIIPKLLMPDSPLKVTADQAEWLETILMLGGCCGLPLNLILVDKIGRRGTLICSSITTLLAWVVMGLSPSIQYIYIARFFAGIAGDTGFVAAPMYIAEIADHRIRGFLSSIIYLMMLLGIVIVYCVAPFVPIWVPCAIGVIFNSITLCTLPFIPESPYYLIFKDRIEDAKRALEKLRHDGDDVSTELSDIVAAIKRQKSERGKPQDIVLVKSNRKALLIMIWLNASQHMSSISVMLMNLHSILEDAGAIYIASSTAGILFAGLMLVAACSASVVIDHFGRRILLMASGIMTGIALLVIAIYFNLKSLQYEVMSFSWLVPVAVLFYAAAFKFGIGLVPIVLTAELFPAKMKAIGMTLSDAFYVGFSVISLQLYHQLKSNGIYVPFYIFAFWCFCTVIVTLFYIPETKGKTLEEIQHLLKNEEKEKLLSGHNNNSKYVQLE